MSKKDAGWVDVAETGNDEEAMLMAGLLQSEGIPAQVEGSSIHQLPENLGALGMSRVMVPPDKADEARKLLASVEQKRRRGAASRPDEKAGE